MAKITISPSPRVYSFLVNGMSFECQIDWREDMGVHPQQILMRDLEECLEQLRTIPIFKIKEPFKLPPLNPNENGAG